MSGHSHASNIKRKKDAEDAKRGKTFSKVSRLITIAAKEKGGDPNANPRLRQAIEDAKKVNMPKDKIEAAVKKGSGESGGDDIEEFVYEAYGPAGVAILIVGITDNKNRSLGEIKQILNQNQGKLAEKGSVQFLFENSGNDWIPKYPFEINDEKSKQQLERLVSALEEQDDTQEIYTNLSL